MQRGQGRGTEVCDTVQTAVDRQPKRMRAHDVTNDTGDRAWLRPLALQAKAILGGTCDAVAEVGSDHGAAVKTCLAAGLPPDVARPLTSANPKRGRFSPDAFTDEGASATSQCPAGEQLTCRFATVEQGRPLRDEATAACSACPLTPPCTRNTGGRRRTRWVAEHLVAEMEPRVRRRPEVMKQRKPWVEHPCGTMQRWWATGYCFMRGLQKVRTEFSVTVLAYHLRRVLNRVEMPRLLAALG